MSKGSRSIFAGLLLAGALALAGCGGDDTSSGSGGILGGSGGGGGGPGGTPPGATTPPPTLGAGCGEQGDDLICISLASVASALPADGTSTSVITATLTRNGAPVTGQIVDFTLSNALLGTLSAASGVSNAGGVSTTTFQAAGTLGAVGITATHAPSAAANTIAIQLTQPPASTPGGIQFISATPSAVGVVGSGQPTTASVVFRVTSPSGGATPGATVNFTLTGPSGSYIGSQDGTPTTATGTTDNLGNVSVPLNAGTAAGPVTITATVTVSGVTFTTSTSVISIGGSVPSARWFSIATERFNLPGLNRFGFQTQLRVFAADRFSNFNILEGTQVTFFTEAGAIDTSVNLDDTGFGEVNIRTQNPMPVLDPIPNGALVPAVVLPNARGHLKVIAFTRGEEAFVDVNGNGLYDPGIDTFPGAGNNMDLGEPFVDANDNRVWDGPGCTEAGCINTHPGEQYFDANLNGRYDPPNGVWDGPGCTQAGCNPNPAIWTSIQLMFTGHLEPCQIIGPALTPANLPATYTIQVNDIFNNVPVPGTSVTISAVALACPACGSYVVADGVSNGPYTRTIVVSDPDPNAVTPASASITLTVTTPGGEVNTCTNSPVSISGTSQ
jgi:hypothetical protein